MWNSYRPGSIAKLDGELHKLRRFVSCHPTLQFVPTMTSCDECRSGWIGETEYITPKILRRAS